MVTDIQEKLMGAAAGKKGAVEDAQPTLTFLLTEMDKQDQERE